MNPTLQWQPLTPQLEPETTVSANNLNEVVSSVGAPLSSVTSAPHNAPHKASKKAEKTHLKKPFQWKKPLLFACAGTLLQFAMFSALSGPATSAASAERVEILVSTKKLERGEPLTSDNFKAVRVSASEALSALVKAEDFEKFKGRRLAIALARNNALPKAALFSDFQERSAPEHIPPGKRLLKLQASLGELANVIKPGDRVDVIAIMDLPQVGKITETLLEAQDVVGVGDNLLDDKNSARQGDELAFFVTPEQFKLLTYAQSFARFSVALRNPNDVARTDGGTAMTLNKFLANPRIQNAVNSDLFKIRKGTSDASR